MVVSSSSSAHQEVQHKQEAEAETETTPSKATQRPTDASKATPEKSRPDKPKTKEQKDEESRTTKLDKEAALPETSKLASVASHDVTEEVDDFLCKLLSTAQDAALVGAKVSIFDEQKTLKDKLSQSEAAMKTVYHQLVARRQSLQTHKVDSCVALVGQAVTHDEGFRTIEAQAKPLTKNISGKRKRANNY